MSSAALRSADERQRARLAARPGRSSERGTRSGSGPRPAATLSRERVQAPGERERSERNAPRSGTAARAPCRSRAKPRAFRRGSRARDPAAPRPTAGCQQRERGPPARTGANSAADRARRPACRRPSDRWLDTLTASPMPTAVEPAAAPVAGELSIWTGPVELVADGIRGSVGRDGDGGKRRSTAIVAAQREAALPAPRGGRPRTTSHASATGTATSGNSPSSSPPGRARRGRHAAGRGTRSSRPPSRMATGTASKCVRTSAPQEERHQGCREHGPARVAARNALRARRRAAPRPLRQPGSRRRRPGGRSSSPVPSRPGSAISGRGQRRILEGEHVAVRQPAVEHAAPRSCGTRTGRSRARRTMAPPRA